MTENFLIGIGGTGARVLEAFVHCCAAGFGPNGKVYLMLIDPDAANGNLSRTEELLADYRALWSKLHGQLDDDNPAFRTELIAADKPVWTVTKETNQSLESYIQYKEFEMRAPSLQGLTDLLFTKQERSTNLNEGFRGHPNIGTVVMADPPLAQDNSPLRWLTERKQPNRKARVFMVGSIFGGTGAAGFPTLAKVLKGEKNTNGWESFLLGGALVLPYFSFSGAPVHRGQEMFVTTQDFPAATKAALHYYEEANLPIDQYYFIGDSVEQEVGKFSPGRKEQKNRPHYVELVSALAAFDFFRQPEPASNNQRAIEQEFFIAGRERVSVGWKDLPVTRVVGDLESLRDEFRRDITQFTLFCYTYLEMGRADYLKNIRQSGGLSFPWFRDAFPKFKERTPATDPSHEMHRDLEERTAKYAADFLTWISNLSDGDSNAPVQLINRDALLNRAGNAAAGALPLRPLGGTEAGVNMSQLILDHSLATDHNKDYFVARLNDKELINSLKPDQAAGERFLNLFFKAAARFSR